ncbi:PTS system phosphoenolpyruvate-protein phosphotransferase [Methylophaga lonarensis MPL]|uniref:Phosphoenolpyruvate-protein phosphotransferase n=1 Tax=Methylophaga lonarensis MPL TaxID=1286106 RepID=M7P3G9_9GAMM|nr:phosphoenolpyruvate--protein phosphotransferase [Methylophaga lonarensis]EMR14062.1 PTS system phosphoenolpyruvate-protein phosphotransferase [Methylophaga lonarensis MPL]
MTLELQGLGVSRGIAIGRAHILFHNQPDVREYLIPAFAIEQEVERLLDAIEQARQQLKSIRNHIPANAPADVTSFIDTHLLMLSDSSLTKVPVEMIRERRCNAEWALQLQRDALINVFNEMDDPYLRTRRDDVDHVVNRIHRILSDQEVAEHEIPDGRLKGHIIIAEDLTPADTVLMQHQGIAAFVTEHGGATSHTTILARSLGIPAIIGVESVRRYVQDNELLIVDGETGTLIAGADALTITAFESRRLAFEQHISSLSRYKSQPTKTRDGKAITLLANAELPEDITTISNAGAQGIGLYRTEFLYMNRLSPPEEEEQLAAYRDVVEGMNNQPVTIRTFDLGADKTVDGGRPLSQAVVTNPALGLRAIRLCLSQPGMFRTQLRAILRASAFGKIKIMFPMISTMNELVQARNLLEQCKLELDNEGIAYDRSIEVGAMIEIPASAVCAEMFARHVDFLSIGTNDLIQYTLAIDRIDDHVNYLYDPLHPAVLRLIQMTLNAGKKHSIPVSMCGEMAGDPRYTRLLLAMGLEHFSMHPNALLEVKQVINETDLSLLPANTLEVLDIADAVETDLLIEQINEAVHNN